MMIARTNRNKPTLSAVSDLRHKILPGLLGVIILTSLSACQLERFRHEKYSCQNSQLNIAEIIIRSAKKGKEVKIFGYDGERTGIIEEISSQLALIRTNDGTLKLNRKTGALTVQVQNRYSRTSCKVSVFTL